MIEFSVHKTGEWLDGFNDPARRGFFQGLMLTLEGHYVDAFLALELFIQTSKPPEFDPEYGLYGEYLARRDRIGREIRAELGPENVLAERAFAVELKQREALELARLGRMPEPFLGRERHLYARAFLFALDNFEKMLAVIAAEQDAPVTLKQIHADLNRRLPHLRDVRNSVHHVEDRVRQKKTGGRGKPLIDIVVQRGAPDDPIAPGAKVFMSGQLLRDTICETMANGKIGQVEVNGTSMRVLQATFQEVMNSFSWQGRYTIFP